MAVAVVVVVAVAMMITIMIINIFYHVIFTDSLGHTV